MLAGNSGQREEFVQVFLRWIGRLVIQYASSIIGKRFALLPFGIGGHVVADLRQSRPGRSM